MPWPRDNSDRLWQVLKVVNLRSGAVQLLASAASVSGPLLLPNVAAIIPTPSPAGPGPVGRVTDLLVLTAVGGWNGGSNGTVPFSWSLLR